MHKIRKHEHQDYKFYYHGYIPDKEGFFTWVTDLITAQTALDRIPIYAGHHDSCVPSGKAFTSVNITFQEVNGHNPITHTCTIDNDLEGFKEIIADIQNTYRAEQYTPLS